MKPFLRWKAEAPQNPTFPSIGTGGFHGRRWLTSPPQTSLLRLREPFRTISEAGLKSSSAKILPANSVLVSSRATIGRIAINRVPLATNQGFKNIVIADEARVLPEFVALAITKLVPTMQSWATGGTFAEISKSKFCELEFPLPPLEAQREMWPKLRAINASSTVPAPF